MKNNKTIIAIIGTIVVIGVIVLSIVLGNDTSKNTTSIGADDFLTIVKQESEAISSQEKKDFINISVDEYLEKYNGSEDSIILVGRSGCQYCTIAEPILQNISYQYDLNIYYISTDDFTEESEEKFMNSDESLNSFATPLFMIVSNGQIKDKTDTLTDTLGYVNFLGRNNIIKK